MILCLSALATDSRRKMACFRVDLRKSGQRDAEVTGLLEDQHEQEHEHDLLNLGI
jgi:hypothetical protein